MPTAKKPKTRAKASSDAAKQETGPKATSSAPAGADQVAPMAVEGVADPDSGALLQRLWSAQVKVLLEIVEKTPPNEIQAATLATIQRFLGDNDIRAETVERRAHELKRMRSLATDFRDNPPGFHDPDDPDGRKDYESKYGSRA